MAIESPRLVIWFLLPHFPIKNKAPLPEDAIQVAEADEKGRVETASGEPGIEILLGRLRIRAGLGDSRQRETEPLYHKKRKSAIAVTLGDREILFPRYIILVLDSDLFNGSRTRQIFYRIYRGFLEIL